MDNEKTNLSDGMEAIEKNIIDMAKGHAKMLTPPRDFIGLCIQKSVEALNEHAKELDKELEFGSPDQLIMYFFGINHMAIGFQKFMDDISENLVGYIKDKVEGHTEH